MTKQETTQILAVLKAAYPAFYKDQTQEELSGAVNIWHGMLSDLSCELITKAIQRIIATNKFAPSIAEVRAAAIGLTATDELSPEEAWTLVNKALRNSTYNSGTEFEKLPEIVQKALGSPSRLKVLSSEDEVFLQTSIAAQFKREYQYWADKAREEALLPESVKQYKALAQAPETLKKPDKT